MRFVLGVHVEADRGQQYQALDRLLPVDADAHDRHAVVEYAHHQTADDRPDNRADAAGGAHHTGYSRAVTTEMLEDYATIAGRERVVIDADTKIRDMRRQLLVSDLAWSTRFAR